MRSGRLLLAGAAMLLSGVAVASAAEIVTSGQDTSPWHIAKVGRLNVARPGPGAAAEAGPQKYLHVEVRFHGIPEAQKKEKFRVVDAAGNEVGELWGWNDTQSLVVFDGNWGSLVGLYLDGLGHREPLFREVPVARVAPVTPAAPTERRTYVDRAPNTVYIPREEVRRDYVVPRVDPVVVRDPIVVRDDVVVGGPRIIDDTPDRVVVRDHADRRIVVDDGIRDTVVVKRHRHGSGKTTIVDVDDDDADVVVDDAATAIARTVGVAPGRGAGGGSGPGAGAGSGSGSGEACPAEGDSGKGEGEGKGKSKADAKAESEGADQAKADCEDKGEGEGKGKGEGEGKGKGKSPAGESPAEDCPAEDSMAQGPGAGPGQGPGPGPGSPGPGTPGPAGPCGEGSGPGPGPGPGGPGSGPGGPGSGGGPGGDCDDGPGPKPYPGPGPYAGPGPGPGRGPRGPIAKLPLEKPPLEKPYELCLYITAGTETSPGVVYQVDENGRVLGKVKLPYTATGIALHRDNGLVLAVPRDGGKIMQIDDTGKQSTLLEKDPSMPHPVDVGVGGDSDTVVVADNIANVIAATTVGGTKPKIYHRLGDQKYTSQQMSVAVTNDKNVMFSTEADTGVFRFGGDQPAAGNKPVLPISGGVAADQKSLRWAAAQEPDIIQVYEGMEPVKKLRLPPKKSFYRNGLLSFSPAGNLIVAVRDSDQQVGEVWLLSYDINKDHVRSLFPWNNEQMQDFTAGPRMMWDRRSPSTYRSTF